MDNLQCLYCESDITNQEMNDSTMPDRFCSSSCEELFREHQADLAFWEMENSRLSNSGQKFGMILNSLLGKVKHE